MTTIDATQGLSGATYGTLEPASNETGALATLPDPVTSLALSGDPGAELAALAVQSGEEEETVAQTGRDAEEKAEVSADDQQVAAMRQKADEIRADGLTEGLGMMAQGGFEMGAAGAMGADGKQTPLSSGLKAGGILAQGGSTVGGAFFKADQANDDARAAAAKSASDQARTAADDLHDAKKGAGDFVSAALDFYREYTSAQASASSAALHRA